MQQRAAVESISHYEPIVNKFVSALHASIARWNVTLPAAQIEAEATHKFQNLLSGQSESNLSPNLLYQFSVAATLDAVRSVKKQAGGKAIKDTTVEGETKLLALLQNALAQLPENRRRVVGLNCIGLSTAEIAELLDWNEHKTQSQIERGLKPMLAKLQEADQQLGIDDLIAIYQSQPSRAELNRADCLADEFLTRACAGDVSESDRLFVADHLTTCKDCAEEYQLARLLKSWPEQALRVAADTDEAEPSLDSSSESALEVEALTETAPKWWQSLIPQFVHYTGFNLFTASLTALFLITSLSLATWLVAQHFKHKVQLAQLQKQQQAAFEPPASTEPATPETLQARVDEAQKQLTDIQTQITEQNADKVLSNQELLGIQNNTLLKELEDLSKPQLDAPVVDIDLAALRSTAEAGKEIVTTIDVPNTSSVFTVILHKPADKNAANYLVELFDAKKTKPIWSAPKKLENQTKIPITLAKRNYPAGKYRFTLSGVEGKKKDLLETYQIEVKYQPLPKQKKKK